MQSLVKLISSWRRWVNRNKTFNKKELDEMEDHLIEEIDYLVKQENLSEEEAFHKAVEEIGKREELSKAVTIVKKEKSTKKKWRLGISLVLLLVIIGVSAFMLKSFSLEEDRFAKTIPMGYPCLGNIEYHFGFYLHPIFRDRDYHTGVDIPAPYGSNLTATGDGVVTGEGWAGGYGRMVTIKHTDELSTRYAHCSKILVKTGDKVKRGQVIALAGATGTATTSHVHYEILENGKPIDPEKFNTDLLSNSQATKK